MGQRGRDINLPVESPFDRIAAAAREFDKIADDARSEPKPPPGPTAPSENPAMAFLSGAGVQPFGEHGLKGTGKGLLNLASNTAKLGPGGTTGLLAGMAGSTFFDNVLAPMLKLGRPETRAAVGQTLARVGADPLGSAIGLGWDPQARRTTLRAAETLPLVGPGFEEAGRRTDTGDPLGGAAYAAGNVASMMSPTKSSPVSNAMRSATKFVTAPVANLATRAARSLAHGDPGMPIPTTAASRTLLDENLLGLGFKAGARKAEDLAGQLSEEAKGLTDYGASAPETTFFDRLRGTPSVAERASQPPPPGKAPFQARNQTAEELAEANRATGREVAGESLDLEQRSARQATEPPATENLWQAILEGHMPSVLRERSSGFPELPTPGASLQEGFTSRANLATPPVSQVPMMREGVGGVRSRTLVGPNNQPQFFAGHGIEGENVRSLFDPGRLKPAQQPFAHAAMLEELNAQIGRGQPLSKRQGVDVIDNLRREQIEKPFDDAGSSRIQAADAQAADLSRELERTTPAARETLERMTKLNDARRVLARKSPTTPLSFQLPWTIRALHGAGAGITQQGFNLGHRIPNLVAGDAYRAALLAKLLEQSQAQSRSSTEKK